MPQVNGAVVEKGASAYDELIQDVKDFQYPHEEALYAALELWFVELKVNAGLRSSEVWTRLIILAQHAEADAATYSD